MTQFAAFYDFSAATVAAIPVLAITLAILAVEFVLLDKQVSELASVTFAATRVQIRLGSLRVPILAVVLVWTSITVVLPLAALISQAPSLTDYAEAFSRASGSILRSVVFAAIGATLLTILGFFGGYLVHTRTLAVWRGIDAAGYFCLRCLEPSSASA